MGYQGRAVSHRHLPQPGMPDELVTYLRRRGIYAIAMGDEAMQVLNLDAVRGLSAS